MEYRIVRPRMLYNTPLSMFSFSEELFNYNSPISHVNLHKNNTEREECGEKCFYLDANKY